MKHIGRNILIAGIVGAVTILAYTLNVVEPTDSKPENMPAKKSMQSSIEATGSVPFVLISSVFRDHEDNYKVILKSQSSKMIAFYSADGEYLKQEIVKPVQVVALN